MPIETCAWRAGCWKLSACSQAQYAEHFITDVSRRFTENPSSDMCNHGFTSSSNPMLLKYFTSLTSSSSLHVGHVCCLHQTCCAATATD
eukprot:6052306-Amphidinium_carterae.1